MDKFYIEKTPSGCFNFSLIATNKEKICVSSQVYKSKDSCKKAIASVIKNSKRCIEENRIEDLTLQKKAEPLGFPKFEIYLDKAGMFRYRLIAPNGESLAISEDGYKSKSSCMNGIKSVGVNAMNSQIEDMTLADK